MWWQIGLTYPLHEQIPNANAYGVILLMNRKRRRRKRKKKHYLSNILWLNSYKMFVGKYGKCYSNVDGCWRCCHHKYKMFVLILVRNLFSLSLSNMSIDICDDILYMKIRTKCHNLNTNQCKFPKTKCINKSVDIFGTFLLITSSSFHICRILKHIDECV